MLNYQRVCFTMFHSFGIFQLDNDELNRPVVICWLPPLPPERLIGWTIIIIVVIVAGHLTFRSIGCCCWPQNQREPMGNFGTFHRERNIVSEVPVDVSLNPVILATHNQVGWLMRHFLGALGSSFAGQMTMNVEVMGRWVAILRAGFRTAEFGTGLRITSFLSDCHLFK